MKIYHLPFLLLLLALIASCKSTQSLIPSTEKSKEIKPVPILTISDAANAFLKGNEVAQEFKNLRPYLKIHSLTEDSLNKTVEIEFNRFFSYIPFREDNTTNLYQAFQSYLPDNYADYEITLKTIGFPIQELIPNFYRNLLDRDTQRIYTNNAAPAKPLVRRENANSFITNGLANRHIAIWHSHGWYYNFKEDRWMWQRARLFGTVEDIYPISYVLPYLVPMLERAGANTFLPRERDYQTNEIIIDNNGSDGKSRYVETGNWKNTSNKGFSIGKRPYQGNINPFQTGTARETAVDVKGNKKVEWIPEIPEDGEYAVYVSYDASSENTTDAEYTVSHSGGETKFFVNQQIGGSTWVYLGTFHFKKGLDSKNQKLTLSSRAIKQNQRISADAARFGGGMGMIERNGRVSNRPKFVEGSRYWLQYAGFPDTLTYQLNDENDYNDDYQSRSEWVNYLVGSPFGPNNDRTAKGLGIPIDLSLAFHTDAGITKNDSTIGTLMIYSVTDFDSLTIFPNGTSRIANRDLGDIMQSEIVHTIRQSFDSTWTRRNLYNSRYSEAFRANVPSVLLELLSHQNFSDMRFGLNPQFRFDVSRAIYKGMLKFLADQNGTDYVVQPLPVTHLNVQLDSDGSFLLKWKEQIDSFEVTAKPDGYLVYTSLNDNGFDNGVFVKENSFTLNKPVKGTIYNFKVEAVNKGGRSMPSGMVSAALSSKGKSPVLIVNAFSRVSEPAVVSEGNFEGFLYSKDRGVPDGYDLSFVGDQFNFDKNALWITDDDPGHGASYANHETEVIAGNTANFSYIHGKAILDAGYSFFSTSLEALEDNFIDITAFKYLDIILGEQKRVARFKQGFSHNPDFKFETFPIKLQSKLKFYAMSGGNIFISGAYLTTDSYKTLGSDSLAVDLLENTLFVKHAADHASKNGVVLADNIKKFSFPEKIQFNTRLNAAIYQVEAPNAIAPIQDESFVVARYQENGFSAATAFEGYYKTVLFGFPFETILSEQERNQTMKAILDFFDKTQN